MKKVASQYIYEGPVYIFDTMITPLWHGQTYATSEAKARSNLAYQYKRINGYASNAKIRLPGKVVFVY